MFFPLLILSRDSEKALDHLEEDYKMDFQEGGILKTTEALQACQTMQSEI